MVLINYLLEGCLGSPDVLLGLRGIDGGVSLELTRLIQHCHLAAGTVSGVDGDYLFSSYRRSHEKVLGILCKDLHGFCFSSLCKHVSHFTLNGGRHKALICILDGFKKKIVIYGRFAALSRSSYDTLLNQAIYRIGFNGNLDFEFLFLFAAVDGEDPVIGYLGNTFREVIVILVYRLLLFILCFCHNYAVILSLLSYRSHDFRIVCYHLSYDIESSLKSFIRSFHFLFRVHIF